MTHTLFDLGGARSRYCPTALMCLVWLGAIAAATVPARADDVEPGLAEPEADGSGGVAGETTGEQRVAVVLFNFQDLREEPYSVEDARAALFGDETTTLPAFFAENSGGRLRMQGTVLGWAQLPEVESFYCRRETRTIDGSQVVTLNRNQLLEAISTVLAPELTAHRDALRYVVLMAPYGSQTCSTGAGYIGAESYRRPDGSPALLRTVVLSLDVLSVGTLAHELGHALGLGHANGRECGEHVMRSSPAVACREIEYGNPLSTMGDSNLSHVDAAQKDALRWLDADAVRLLRAPGTYRETLVPLEDPAAFGVRALKIGNGQDEEGIRLISRWYYVEYPSPWGSTRSWRSSSRRRQPARSSMRHATPAATA